MFVRIAGHVVWIPYGRGDGVRSGRRHVIVSDEHDGSVVGRKASDLGSLDALAVRQQRRPPTPSREFLERRRDRLLDGPNAWGSIERGPDRQGFRRYRLTLFPPGVTTSERRLLRLWRGLPGWGVVLWSMAVIGLSHTYGTWLALGMASGVWFTMAVAISARLGAVRTQVRTMTVVTIAGHTDADTAAAYTELRLLASTMAAADVLLAQRRISAAEHESLWWQAYERLGK